MKLWKIKGFPKIQIMNEIERIATFVGLQYDLVTLSKSLSGGMKRRLSVAMALIGDAKIIILGFDKEFKLVWSNFYFLF